MTLPRLPKGGGIRARGSIELRSLHGLSDLRLRLTPKAQAAMGMGDVKGMRAFQVVVIPSGLFAPRHQQHVERGYFFRGVPGPPPTVDEFIGQIRPEVAAVLKRVLDLRTQWKDRQGHFARASMIKRFTTQVLKVVDQFRIIMHRRLEVLQDPRDRASGQDIVTVTHVLRLMNRFREQMSGLVEEVKGAVLKSPIVYELLRDWANVQNEFFLNLDHRDAAYHWAVISAKAHHQMARLYRLSGEALLAAQAYFDAGMELFALELWEEGVAAITDAAIIFDQIPEENGAISYFLRAAKELEGEADRYEMAEAQVRAYLTVMHLHLLAVHHAISHRQFLWLSEPISTPLEKLLDVIQSYPEMFASSEIFREMMSRLKTTFRLVWGKGQDTDERLEAALLYQVKVDQRNRGESLFIAPSALVQAASEFWGKVQGIIEPRMHTTSSYTWSDLYGDLTQLKLSWQRRADYLRSHGQTSWTPMPYVPIK